MTNLSRSCPQTLSSLRQVGATALIIGAQEGHAQVVQMLLAAGANKDLQNNVRRPQPRLLPTRDQEDAEFYKTLPLPLQYSPDPRP